MARNGQFTPPRTTQMYVLRGHRRPFEAAEDDGAKSVSHTFKRSRMWPCTICGRMALGLHAGGNSQTGKYCSVKCWGARIEAPYEGPRVWNAPSRLGRDSRSSEACRWPSSLKTDMLANRR